MKNEKDFDAVKMMRDIREKRHIEYKKSFRQGHELKEFEGLSV